MPTTPKAITESTDAWFWRPNWQRMHRREQQFNGVITGQCGTGKSFASLCIANLLDRRSDNEPRFTVDRIAFSAKDFTRLANQKMPIGSFIIIDDAAFTAYSKDALTREVKQVAKIFISHRDKRRGVLLSIPSLDMLAKNIRQTLLYYIEMDGIDYDLNQSFAKLMRIQLNPRYGKIYLKRYTYTKKGYHIEHQVAMSAEYLRPKLTFDLPSKELIRDYKKAKAVAMKINYEEAERIVGNKRVKRFTLADSYVVVKQNLQQFTDRKGMVDMVRLMMGGFSDYRARQLSKMINDEIRTSKP